MSGKFFKQFLPLQRRWKNDIFAFAREGMNFEPTWQQEDAFRIVQNETLLPLARRKKRLAIASGQGPGKTTAANVIAWWRVLQDVNAMVVVTAPSMRQCTDVFMAEGRRLYQQSHPVLRKVFRLSKTKLTVAGYPDWGIRTATASRPENIQGYHQKHLTFIEEESSGVPAPISEQIKGTLSNPNSLYIRVGNPNTTSCDFYQCFTSQRHLWHTLRWNAEDTARDYPHIVHPSRNKALELEYGRDSNPYKIRVLGEFPSEDPNSVMSIEDLEACVQNALFGAVQLRDVLPADKVISIDFARYGGDESVVAARSGLGVVDFKTFAHRDPREVVDYAFSLQQDKSWSSADCTYVADAGGMGQGVMHSFYESGKNVHEFVTQGRPIDGAMFADKMSEAWWCLRTLVRERICSLPNDRRLIQQLSTRQYYTDRKGKIKIETKDEWRKRMQVNESPDRADATVMAFYQGVGLRGMSGSVATRSRKVGQAIRQR